jgi:hypothetical protein
VTARTSPTRPRSSPAWRRPAAPPPRRWPRPSPPTAPAPRPGRRERSTRRSSAPQSGPGSSCLVWRSLHQRVRVAQRSAVLAPLVVLGEGGEGGLGLPR